MIHIYELINLSDKYSASERLEALTDIDSSIESGTKKEMDDMCNLSDAIYNKGYRDAAEKGNLEKLEMIIEMYKKGISLEVISECAKLSVNKICELLNISQSK